MPSRSPVLFTFAALLGAIVLWLAPCSPRAEPPAATARAAVGAPQPAPPSVLAPELVRDTTVERRELPPRVDAAEQPQPAAPRNEAPRLAGSVELQLEVTDSHGGPLDAVVSASLSRSHRVEHFAERDGAPWLPKHPELVWGEPFKSEAAGVMGHMRGSVEARPPANSGGPHVVPLDTLFARALEKSNLTTKLQPLPLELMVARAGFERQHHYGLVLAIDPSELRPERPLVLHASLQLPTSCEVTGRVRAPAGERTHLRAALFAWDGVEPGPVALAMVSAHDEQGSFGLELGCTSAHVVVLFADGLRPHSRILPTGFSGDLGLVVLERGESISGRADLDGAGVRALVRAEFARPGVGALRPLVGGWVRWTPAGFEWDRLSTSTDAEGAFEFGGLAQARYAVALGGVSGAYSSDAGAREFDAPARGLVLSPSLCRVRLQLFLEGVPAADSSFEILDHGPSGAVQASRRTDSNGEAVLWLDPSRAVKVRFWLGASEGSKPVGLERTVECSALGSAAPVRVDF